MLTDLIKKYADHLKILSHCLRESDEEGIQKARLGMIKAIDGMPVIFKTHPLVERPIFLAIREMLVSTESSQLDQKFLVICAQNMQVMVGDIIRIPNIMFESQELCDLKQSELVFLDIMAI